ncbi:MAG TPA: glycerophosphodiester phosphodiesterase family protein [Solimonas sp.]|nr:glycerophosphodiester phosphodiesterase family protein [Solimonas sp.]
MLKKCALAATALLAACGDSSTSASAPQACPAAIRHVPLVSAHRGGAAYAPENTLVSFQNAVRLGADELEMDTQQTADGELVVIHDDSLDRTTDCTGTLLSHTLAEVQACDAAHWFAPGQATTTPDETLPHPLRGQGVRVPTLRQVLDWYVTLGCNPPRLSIEIKNIPGESNFDPAGNRIAQVLVPLLAQYGVRERSTIQSFWPLTVDAVKSLDPALRTQFLTSSGTGQTAAMNLSYVVAGGHEISAPNFDAPDFGAPFIQAAHGAGKQVIPYTADEAADIALVAGLGIDGLITNFPACALHATGREAPMKVTPEGVPEIPACPGGAAFPVASAERPDAATCAALRPPRWQAALGHAEPGAQLRAVGIQFKQEVRHVESYETFRTKMRCLMQDHVVPLMQPGLPTLVVFNEDIGLMTLATGTRGAAVRALATSPLHAPIGDAQPATTAGALALLNLAYAPQIAAYQLRFGPVDPRKQALLAATDTFARGFSRTFSDIARDYGVYVVASNNQAHYRASRDPAELALFADPDLAPAEEVYVATSASVANRTFLWGPQDFNPAAPPGETNLLFVNDKVPLTDIELTLLALDEGPATGAAALANAAGHVVAGFRLGFATSLPAFQWGHAFGAPPPAAPCADVHTTYMSCMDALGVDVVVQAEANPGRWASYQAGGWQPLEWMESTWRTSAEPSAHFLYNITPHLVGNLLDLPFDGQSAITRRGGTGVGAHYVGNLEFDEAQDPAAYRGNVGDKAEFIALAPWVTPDAPRADLLATGTALSPGSGDALENDYLETAVWADLVK